MSASREKKVRQERGADYVSPKEQKAREDQAANRRTTIIFAVCAAVFVLGVAAMLLWNSGVFRRNAAAVRVDGDTYTAADVAYFYYNGRSNLLNNSSTYGIDSDASLREQIYDGEQTWYDYLVDESVQTLASAALTAKAAKAAGFDGGEALEQTVSDTLDSLKSSASSYGYTTSQYLKAIYGPLMTRGVFERNLRMVALAQAYTESIADVANYSDAELTAQYESDPSACSLVRYELAVFYDGASSSEDESEENTAAPTAAELAESALARFSAGESFEAVVEELGGSYSDSYAYPDSSSSELIEWLFDGARQDGDTTVLDYSYYGYTLGSMAVVYRGMERADFNTVSVRHILVEDEDTANDVLAQYLAGEQTEDAFAALAEENSTDNADEGGLYTGIRPGQMVKPFEDWCFDAARQPDDTGIVETDYGFHVMYFVERSPYECWQELAASALASSFSDSVAGGADTELLSGMKYIDA